MADETKQGLTHEIQELGRRRDELNSQVSGALLAIDQAKEELAGIQNDIDTLKRQREQDQITTTEYEARRTGLEAQLDTLNETIKSLTKDVQTLQNKRDNLEAEVIAFNAARPDREAAERARVGALVEAEMTQRRADITGMIQQRMDEEVRRDEAIATGNTYRADNEVLEGRNTELEASVAAGTAQVAALDTSISEKQKQDKALDDSISTKTADEAALVERNAELTATNAALDASIADKTAEEARLADGITTMTADYQTKEKQLFAFGKRETALNQREAFTKAKYEEAGIAYTPIPQ